LQEKKKKGHLKGHVDEVTDLAFTSARQDRLLSVGRDKTIIAWNLTTMTRMFIIPTYEVIESCCWSKNSKGQSLLCTVGEMGKLRRWDIGNRKEVEFEKNHISEPLFHVFSNQGNIIAVSEEQNFYTSSSATGELLWSFAGNNEQILDIKTMPPPYQSSLLLASNSAAVRLQKVFCNQFLSIGLHLYL
jgi:WD40 repeat protein